MEGSIHQEISGNHVFILINLLGHVEIGVYCWINYDKLLGGAVDVCEMYLGKFMQVSAPLI